jgi:hypothetical protein
VAELVAKHPERHPVLKCERHGGGKTIHKAGYRRAFLRCGDEDLPWAPVRVKPNRQIAFVPAYVKVMDNSFALVGQAPPNGLHGYCFFDFRHKNLSANLASRQ